MASVFGGSKVDSEILKPLLTYLNTSLQGKEYLVKVGNGDVISLV